MEFSDGLSEFSQVFNFTIICYLRNSRKLGVSRPPPGRGPCSG